jgi:hypothetical protein
VPLTVKQKKAALPPVDAGPDMCKFADEYLAASALVRENTPIKEKRKKALLDWIGSALTKTLPDGRIVMRTSVDVAAESEPRKAHVAITVTIVPAPAAPAA